GDLDQLRQVLAGAGRIEEVQRPGRVRRADVQVQARCGRARGAAAQLGAAAGGLEHLAGHLVDGRVAVAAEWRVGRRVGRVPDSVAVAQAVRALVPGLAPVRTGADEVVPGQVDERRRTRVRRLVGRAGRGVVDGEPLPVGAGA